MNENQKDRVTCLLKFMDYDYLTDDEHRIIVSLERQFERKGYLSNDQIELLESINKCANERDRPFRR